VEGTRRLGWICAAARTAGADRDGRDGHLPMPGVVTWPDLPVCRTESAPMLVDEDTGRRIYMRHEGSGYPTPAPEGGGIRRFRLELLEQGGRGARLARVVAAAAARGGAGLPSCCPRRDVTARILNIAGVTGAKLLPDRAVGRPQPAQLDGKVRPGERPRHPGRTHRGTRPNGP